MSPNVVSTEKMSSLIRAQVLVQRPRTQPVVVTHQQLDAALRLVEPACAAACQRDAALERSQRLLEWPVALLEALHHALESLQNLLERQLLVLVRNLG